MLSALRKIARWKKKVEPADLDALIERVNVLSRIQGVGGTQVTSGPLGVNVKGDRRKLVESPALKIFEVQSTATGDDVYNCYEQKIDATDWTSTGEVDKLVDKDSESVEVYNLLQNYIYSAGVEQLGIYDRLAAWQVTDDEGNDRWVGIPMLSGRTRLAITTEDAPASDEITCNLLGYNGQEISSGLGSGIEVVCYTMGGAALNSAIPRLVDRTVIGVFNINGTWVCTNLFQTSEDCACS